MAAAPELGSVATERFVVVSCRQWPLVLRSIKVILMATGSVCVCVCFFYVCTRTDTIMGSASTHLRGKTDVIFV